MGPIISNGKKLSNPFTKFRLLKLPQEYSRQVELINLLKDCRLGNLYVDLVQWIQRVFNNLNGSSLLRFILLGFLHVLKTESERISTPRAGWLSHQYSTHYNCNKFQAT